MSKKRKIWTSRFTFIVESIGARTYVVYEQNGELCWEVIETADCKLEVQAQPDQAEIPPRLTNDVVLAAVRKYQQFEAA